jgi:hypothetical protein
MTHFIFIPNELATLTGLRMTRKSFISAFLFLIFVSTGTRCFAQWYLDTATPEEAAARDKPYLYLQNEIQKKLCDKDWGTDKTAFTFLTQKQSWKKIVRGGHIVRLTFTGGGDDCLISMQESSPLYKANLDSSSAVYKKMTEIMKWGLDQQKAVMQAKDPLTAAQRFKKDHQKTMDSVALLNARLQREGNRLFNEQTFAQVSLILNDDRIEGKELQDFRAFKVQQLNGIPGIEQAILYCQLPDKDNPDTLYRAALYIGNFPKFSIKMQPYSYKYFTKYTWADKAHSGKAVVENGTISIATHHYANMMKVIHSIDWVGLESIIKNNQ